MKLNKFLTIELGLTIVPVNRIMTPQELAILNYLCYNQTEEGEFKSLCYLPGAEQPIWYYSGVSPFLTGNALHCISSSKHEKAQAIITKGCGFLISLLEKYGLLRYWEHDSKIMLYNVPCDVDDTSIGSYILESNGTKLDNKHLFYGNMSPDNMFYTWFLPRAKQLRYTSYYFYSITELFKTRKVFLPNKNIPKNEPISSIFDRESAVDANVVLYLGANNQTKKTIDKLISDTINGSYSLQYYDQDFFVHYHISRAYASGVLMLSQVREKILQASMEVQFDYSWQENYLRYVLNTITLINFKLTCEPIYAKYIDFIQNDPMHERGWQPFKYWTSKQRSWWAGSPEMTAALYFEALTKHEQLSQ